MKKPRYQKARATARELLTKFGITKSPVDPRSIAKKLGIRVVTIEAKDASLSGFMMRSHAQTRRPLIGLNKKHSRVRQRFTVAHEVGHFLLHEWGDLRVDRSIISFRDERSSKAEDAEEIEANQFAAELLMPSEWVRREVRGGHFDLADDEAVRTLANRFQVSQQAMSYRLNSLGLS